MGKPNRSYFRCSICGKLLMERQSNGLWHFLFGRRPDEQDVVQFPVDMLIHGSIKMKCLRRSCRTKSPDHWNVLNFFPGVHPANRSEEERMKAIGNEPSTSGVELAVKN